MALIWIVWRWLRLVKIHMLAFSILVLDSNHIILAFMLPLWMAVSRKILGIDWQNYQNVALKDISIKSRIKVPSLFYMNYKITKKVTLLPSDTMNLLINSKSITICMNINYSNKLITKKWGTLAHHQSRTLHSSKKKPILTKANTIWPSNFITLQTVTQINLGLVGSISCQAEILWTVKGSGLVAVKRITLIGKEILTWKFSKPLQG